MTFKSEVAHECNNCKFYDHSNSDCHRHAPRSEMKGMIPRYFDDDDPKNDDDVWNALTEPHWPTVKPNDWCGEFVPLECGA